MIEYSFGTRTLREAASEQEPREDEPVRRDAPAATGSQSELDRSPRARHGHVRRAEGDRVAVRMPGVERKDIRCILDGDILLLEAKTGERLYRKETLIEGKLAGGPRAEPAQRRSRGAVEQAA